MRPPTQWPKPPRAHDEIEVITRTGKQKIKRADFEFAAEQMKKAAAKIEKCINCGMPSELTVFRGQAHAYCLCLACARYKASTTEAKRVLTPWPTDPIEALRRARTHGGPRFGFVKEGGFGTSSLSISAHTEALRRANQNLEAVTARYQAHHAAALAPEWRLDWRDLWFELKTILDPQLFIHDCCWREQSFSPPPPEDGGPPG